MRRIGWKAVLEGFAWSGAIGAVTIAQLTIFSCAGPGARLGTLDHNRVSATANVPVTATANLDAVATVQAQLDAAVVQIGELRAALIGPISVGPVAVGPIGGIDAGGYQAGRDLTTVDSLTAQVLAKTLASTLKWSVLISVVSLAIYVLAHRFRWTREVLDVCKGKPPSHEATEPRSHEGKAEG